MGRLITNWKIPAIGIMAFLVGLTAITTVQVLEPDVVSAFFNGPERSDDHGDGYGDSHYTRVRYTRQLSPWKADVDWVNIGGRPYHDNIPCTVYKWRTRFNDYYRWNGSSWVREERNTSIWWDTDSQELTYYYDNEDVELTGGAMIKHQNAYQSSDSCFPDSGTFTLNGPSLHRHYLE